MGKTYLCTRNYQKQKNIILKPINIMVNRFILNEVSYFGAGARKQLPDVLKRLNLNKALVATDKGLLKVVTAKMVTDVLD